MQPILNNIILMNVYENPGCPSSFITYYYLQLLKSILKHKLIKKSFYHVESNTSNQKCILYMYFVFLFSFNDQIND